MTKQTLAIDRPIHFILSGRFDAHAVRAMYKVGDPLRGCVFLPLTRRYLTPVEIDARLGEALGKVETAPVSRSQTRVATLRAWMAGDRVRLIVVSNAELLTVASARHLIDHAEALDAEIWLVCGDKVLQRGFKAFVTDEGPEPEPVSHLFARLREVPELPEAPQPGPRPLRAVPDEDWPTFAAECDELLHPADARRACDELRRGGEAIGAALIDRPGDVTAARASLRRLLTDDRPAGELIARVRGAQTAGVLLGVHIKVEVDVLRSAPPAVLEAPTAETARAVRRSAHMRAVAAACVALATSAPPRQIADLNVGDVAEDAVTVAMQGEPVAVPTLLRGPIRSYLLVRRMHGANADDPLFVALDAARRVADRQLPPKIRGDLARLALTTGVAAYVDAEESGEDVPWLRRRGITVTALWPTSAAAGR